MFKFNFSIEDSTEAVCKSVESVTENIRSAQCLEIISNDINEDYNFKPLSIENYTFSIRDLENVNTDTASLHFLNSYKDCDVIPTIYEGGLKVWECTYDLLMYFIQNNIDFSGKAVLDLGCGCGLLGIYASLKNAESVHFQDYNADVLRNFTIPNARQNNVKSKTKFFSGDWESFSIYDSAMGLYDYIVCSEVLYNLNSYPKLGNLFKRKLRPEGKIMIASKSYYFGVGGSVKQFEDFLSDLKYFSCKSVWKTTDGVQREIVIIEKMEGEFVSNGEKC